MINDGISKQVVLPLASRVETIRKENAGRIIQYINDGSFNRRGEEEIGEMVLAGRVQFLRLRSGNYKIEILMERGQDRRCVNESTI